MSYTNLATQKVKFLNGTQANLETLMTSGNAVEGAFYLTSDTHRLYVGRSDGSSVKPVPVNEGVRTVKDTTALAALTDITQGLICYVSDDNILAIRSGNQWVQINPDTFLKASSSAVAVSVTDGVAEIATTVQDVTSVGGTAAHTVSGSFKIKQGANVAVAADGTGVVKVGAKDTVASVGFAAHQITDAGDSTKMSVGGTINKADGGAETITATDTIFAPGNYMDTIAYSDGTITFNAKDQRLSSMTIANTQNSGNGFAFAVKDATNQTVEAAFDPVVTIGNATNSTDANKGKHDVHFVDGKAALNVYTVEEVDTKLAAAVADAAGVADAMTFKGVITSAGNLPLLSESAKGDVYRIGGTALSTSAWADKNAMDAPTSYDKSTLKAGDIIVADGTETSGVITSGGTWYVIPSGDDLQYSSYVNGTGDITNGIEIHDNSTSPSRVVGLQIANATDDASITITSAAAGSSGDDAKTKIISIKQKDNYTTYDLDASASYTQTAKSATNKTDTTVKVISGLEVDKYGNVVSATQSDLVLTDSHANISSVAYTLGSTDDTTKTIKMTVTDSDSVFKEDTISLVSNSISLSVDNANSKITADILWGSF